jgi:16S rRNA (cytidine1402-2'-O)-methyltransferase
MEQGTLYIIASPIGNLGDMTFRAVSILKEKIDAVYCEDTRQTKKLLNHYGINLPTRSLHTHSSEQKLDNAVDFMLEGHSAAYITDSGTPGISDPGSRLVAAARDRGITVCPIPGPSALAAIASVSGFHGKHIIFAGFLARKDGKRRKELTKLKEFPGLIIIYESPYRIKKLMPAIQEVFPGRQVLIGREMTKLFEEFIFGTSDELMINLDAIKEKGEFAVAINNDPKHSDEPEDDDNITDD